MGKFGPIGAIRQSNLLSGCGAFKIKETRSCERDGNALYSTANIFALAHVSTPL